MNTATSTSKPVPADMSIMAITTSTPKPVPADISMNTATSTAKAAHAATTMVITMSTANTAAAGMNTAMVITNMRTGTLTIMPIPPRKPQYTPWKTSAAPIARRRWSSGLRNCPA